MKSRTLILAALIVGAFVYFTAGPDSRLKRTFSSAPLWSPGVAHSAGLGADEMNNIDIYKTTFRPMKHTLSGRDERMLMKLVVDKDTDRMLGCHICGPDAGEMIQLLGIAVRLGATKADFDATMAVHPTAAEELVTMRDPWAG